MTALPIVLSEGFSALVKEGDTIISGQLLARKAAPKDEIVNLFDTLHINRSEAKKVLKKGPGDQIKPGDIVAVKKNIFGKVLSKIVSEIDGTIIRYERDTGNLVVRNDLSNDLKLISPVAGTVTLCNNREIVLQTEHAVVTNGVSLGNSAQGDLYVLQESFTLDGMENALYYLDHRAVGKIVIVQGLTRDLVSKGNSIGAAGFLGLHIGDNELLYMEEKSLPMPVLQIDETLLETIHQWENKPVYVDVMTKAIVLL